MTDTLNAVYQAIKEHNSARSMINGIETKAIPPAYTGHIKQVTGLELDEIHQAIAILLEQNLIVMQGRPLIGKGRSNYGQIINYPGLIATELL